MQMERVVTILDTLAAGGDPSMLQTPEVIRALYTAANALRGPGSKRAAAGSRWSEEEDSLLCHEFDDGTPVAGIAKNHGRTANAIKARLVKLGRLEPEEATMRQRGS